MGDILKIHSVETMGALDGPGIRYVLFLKGCPLRCAFCHNPDTWAVSQGLEKSAREVADDVFKYKEFFEASGGGFTASGGEPLLQAEALGRLFEILKSGGISTALDTCGYADLVPSVEKLVSLTDLFLLDIKHLDPETHVWLTGKSNDKILRFLEYVSAKKKPVHIRIVLLNGVSAAVEYAERLASFLEKFPTVKRVDLLPYHTLGVKKWSALGLKYRLDDSALVEKSVLESVAEVFRSRGFETTLQ